MKVERMVEKKAASMVELWAVGLVAGLVAKKAGEMAAL